MSGPGTIFEALRAPGASGFSEIEREGGRAWVARELFGPEFPAFTIGRFELGPCIGVGGMGRVYRANDPDLDREVAVKLVRRDRARQESWAEAKALAKLSHPNVVAVYDVGVIDEFIYIVMELVRGQTLREYVDAEGRSFGEVLTAYRAAGMGLAAAHAAGLIHRDFKPDNVLVDKDGRVRVIDFGLARDLPKSTSTDPEPSMTLPGAGTPRYMSPEQRAGGPLTPACDQYAFAVSLREAIDRLLERGSLRSRPNWIDPIIARAASNRPEARYASMDALVRALARNPQRRLSAWIVAGGLATGLNVAYAAGRGFVADVDAVDPCSGGSEAIDRTWSPQRRADALARLEGLGRYARSVRPELDAVVAGFVERWVEQYREACVATHRGEQSEQMLDRRMACLAEIRASLSAAGEYAATVEPEGVPNLALVLRTLEEPERCGELERLGERPLGEAARAVEAQLARARVAIELAASEEIEAQIEDVVEAARQVGDSRLLARALSVQGAYLIERHRLRDATAVLDESTRLAIAAGDDETAIDAWSQRAYSEGVRADEARHRALDGLDVMKAIASRVPNTKHAVRFYRNISPVYMASGQRPLAREASLRAIELAQAVPGARRELADALFNAALASDDADERIELVSRSTALWEDIAGTLHPRTITSRVAVIALREDSASIVAELGPVCALLEQNHPSLGEDIGLCLLELAFAADNVDARELAFQAFERAANHSKRSRAKTGMAYVALWSGRPEDADDRFTQLIADLSPAEEGEQAWWIDLDLAEAELGRARARRAMGRADANTWMARAIARFEKHASVAHLARARRRLTFARSLQRRWSDVDSRE